MKDRKTIQYSIMFWLKFFTLNFIIIDILIIGDSMQQLLFSLNLEFAFLIAFIFIFVIPILLMLINNRLIFGIYFFIFILSLLMGVLLDISIKDHICHFSILITTTWFSNSPIIANFDTFGIIINLLLLFPLGFILPLIIPKITFNKVIIFGTSTSIVIEILQFILPIIRYPELLDVLNNTISVILGYLYYLLIFKIRGEINDKLSKQKNTKHKKRIC